jgi:hypothetical protein
MDAQRAWGSALLSLEDALPERPRAALEAALVAARGDLDAALAALATAESDAEAGSSGGEFGEGTAPLLPASGAAATPPPLAPADIADVCVFLISGARARLMRAVPPRHGRVLAHGLVLAERPSAAAARRLLPLLGREACLVVLNAATSELAQVVEVSAPRWVEDLLQGAPPHVAVSTLPGAGAADAAALAARGAPTRPVRGSPLLHGVVGARLADGAVVHSREELDAALARRRRKAGAGAASDSEEEDLDALMDALHLADQCSAEASPASVLALGAAPTALRAAAEGHASARRLHSDAAEAAAARGAAAAAAAAAGAAARHAGAAANARRGAAAAAFQANNAELLNTFTVDLHGLAVAAAISTLRKHLKHLGALRHPGGVLLRLVVGHGLHSAGGRPKLLPAVVVELGRHPLLFDTDEDNPGVVRVLLDAAYAGGAAGGAGGKARRK